MLQETTAQRKIAELTGKYRIVQGGTSSSKTFSIIPLLIEYAMQNDGLEISMVSESHPHLRRGVIRDFEKIMQWTGLWNRENFNKSSYTYRFDNGSFIEFFSADKADSLRGARRDVLFVNEANNIKWEAFYQLATRTRHICFIDFNPSSEFWAHTELMQDPDSSHIILTYEDNEALDEGTVKELLKAKEKAKTSEWWANWWRVYGLGQIGLLQGVIFQNWKQIDKIPEEAELLGYGLDFGFNDPMALVACYKYEGKYIFDEVVFQSELTNRDLSNLMKEKFVDNRQFIYCDSSAPQSIAELKRYGWKTIGAKKPAGSIMFGIQKLQEEEFQVTSRSTNMIKELRNYSWATDRAGDTIEKPIDAFNHSIDAMRYFMTSLASKPTGKYSYGRV